MSTSAIEQIEKYWQDRIADTEGAERVADPAAQPFFDAGGVPAESEELIRLKATDGRSIVVPASAAVLQAIIDLPARTNYAVAKDGLGSHLRHAQ